MEHRFAVALQGKIEIQLVHLQRLAHQEYVGPAIFRDQDPQLGRAVRDQGA